MIHFALEMSYQIELVLTRSNCSERKWMDGQVELVLKVQCVLTCILLLLLSPLLQLNSPDLCLHLQNLTSVCGLIRFNSILSDEN